MELKNLDARREHCIDMKYALLFGVDRRKLRKHSTAVVDGKLIEFDEYGNEVKTWAYTTT